MCVYVTEKRKRESNCDEVCFLDCSVLPKLYEKTNKRPGKILKTLRRILTIVRAGVAKIP